MSSKKTDKLYSDEISLLTNEELAAYVELNLRKIIRIRRKFDIPVVCIAGSEGKTTAKRMLTAILRPDMRILETPPDCSTTSGVTSTLLKLDETYDLAILELGIVNPDQFEWAVRVSKPTIGIITNIGEAHLATLGDKYLIADAKVELVRQLPKDGYALLNIDDDLVSTMAKYAKTPNIIKFGLNHNAQFYATKIEYLGPDGLVFYVNGFYRFHLPIYNSALIYNALTAIAAARLLGIEFDDIREGLENRFSLLEHRGNLIKCERGYILDYTYDATVNSVTKACESLAQFEKFSDKLILVIGDISEPGPDIPGAHLKLGYYLAALPVDTVISVGKNARYVVDGIKRINPQNKIGVSCLNHAELLEIIDDHLVPNATVLFIGSRDLELDIPLKEIAQRMGQK